MSYILDALRRADRERQRHAVPTVHTMQSSMDELEQAPSSASPWAWAMAAGAVALLGVAAWAWWYEPVRSAELPGVSSAGRNPSVPMPPLPPAEMPAQVVASLGDAPGSAPVPAAPPPNLSATVKPVPASPALPAAPAAPLLKLDATVQPAKVAPPALPPGLRTELGLSVDGAIYSDRKEDRMLIVGGQLFREGEKLRDDLVLETIQPKSAVIRHKGQRYTVTF